MRISGVLLLCVSALSACGGGDGGSVEQSVSLDATPIRVFTDSSGVARIVGSAEGEQATGYVISPEIADFAREAEGTGDVEPIDPSSLRVVERGPNTTIRTGAFSQDGETINVVAAVTDDEDAALIFLEEPRFGYSALLALGDQVSNIPTGTVNYSGVMGMQGFGRDAEIGTFTATANFSGNPAITLNGATNRYTVNGSGVINGGSFASSTMNIADGGSNVGATMVGDFHGSGANSLSGVIYSNDGAGRYRGGFVGSQ